MKTEELFSLGLRLVGLLVLLYGLGILLDGILFSLNYFIIPETSPRYYIVTGIIHSLVGLFLLRGASPILTFAYPQEEYEEFEDENTNENNKSEPSK